MYTLENSLAIYYKTISVELYFIYTALLYWNSLQEEKHKAR